MLNLSLLNDAQREAVMHGDGALLVLAGPGSGKTFTITQRIFYLIEEKRVLPENILVITFTKEAALSMQSRFFYMSKQTFPVNFGTFHSVFYHILKESPHFKQVQIITEAEKRKLMYSIVKGCASKEEIPYRQDLTEDVSGMLSAISYFKNTGAKEKALKVVPDEWHPYFEHIYQEYEKQRKNRKAIDFDDMVYECYQLLAGDSKVRTYWQNRFQHILIDEFQDINPMQYRVIELLAKDTCNLFAVGDDDQSIYGFRGSKPELLKEFVHRYQAKKICLNVNYRSTEEIVKASLSVIEENRNRFSKQLKAAWREKKSEKDPNALSISKFEEREQEYDYLVSQLRRNPSGTTVGVLFRTNAYMQSLAARLSREGIHYAMKEKVKSIYEHFIVKDIMAYLQVAGGTASRAMFLQIMNKPSRKISREAVGEGIPKYQEMVQYYQKKGLNAYQIQVIQLIEQWERQMQCLSRLSPFPAVQYIRKAVGYEVYLKKRAQNEEQWREWKELLEWLCEEAANYATVEEWLDAQQIYERELQNQREKTREDSDIALMTVHGSKGLEFDRVYIPDCNEKVFPHGAMPDEEACEEERRIFYVAMTRAKKSLELLYLTGTKERPRLPSRFLNPLLKNYSCTSSSNSQLSKYSSKASATRSYSSSSSM